MVDLCAVHLGRTPATHRWDRRGTHTWNVNRGYRTVHGLPQVQSAWYAPPSAAGVQLVHHLGRETPLPVHRRRRTESTHILCATGTDSRRLFRGRPTRTAFSCLIGQGQATTRRVLHGGL